MIVHQHDTSRHTTAPKRGALGPPRARTESDYDCLFTEKVKTNVWPPRPVAVIVPVIRVPVTVAVPGTGASPCSWRVNEAVDGPVMVPLITSVSILPTSSHRFPPGLTRTTLVAVPVKELPDKYRLRVRSSLSTPQIGSAGVTSPSPFETRPTQVDATEPGGCGSATVTTISFDASLKLPPGPIAITAT